METALEQHNETELTEMPANQAVVPAVPRRISLIEKYKAEIKIARETLKEALDENPAYEEAVVEAQAALRKKKQIKDEIWTSADCQALLAKIKENQEEIATLEEILTTELMQIYQDHNTDEVAGEDGEPRKFKVVAKLLPKSKNKDTVEPHDEPLV